MGKNVKSNRIARIFKTIYLKLIRINDSAIKIALGFGLGVFVGIMPGIGPVAALLLAFLLRVNRASAFLGSVLFNTWVGALALLPAIKIGSAVMGFNYSEVYEGVNSLIKSFAWKKLFEASVYGVLIPLGVGYTIIASVLAVVASVIVYVIARQIKRKRGQSNFLTLSKNHSDPLAPFFLDK
jgi:uncharacterized protein (DUF2062 family)